MVNLDLWLNARWTCLGFNPSQFMKPSRRKTQPQQKLSKNTSVPKKVLQILEERQKLSNITQSHDGEFATFFGCFRRQGWQAVAVRVTCGGEVCGSGTRPAVCPVVSVLSMASLKDACCIKENGIEAPRKAKESRKTGEVRWDPSYLPGTHRQPPSVRF